MWFENEKAKRVFNRLNRERTQAKKQRELNKVLKDQYDDSHLIRLESEQTSEKDAPQVVSQATPEEEKELLGQLDDFRSELTKLVVSARKDPTTASKTMREEWWPKIKAFLLAHVPGDFEDVHRLNTAVQSELPVFAHYSSGPEEAFFRMANGERSAGAEWLEDCQDNFIRVQETFDHMLQHLRGENVFFVRRPLSPLQHVGRFFRKRTVQSVMVIFLLFLAAAALCFFTDPIRNFLAIYKFQTIVIIALIAAGLAYFDKTNRNAWILTGCLASLVALICSIPDARLHQSQPGIHTDSQPTISASKRSDAKQAPQPQQSNKQEPMPSPDVSVQVKGKEQRGDESNSQIDSGERSLKPSNPPKPARKRKGKAAEGKKLK